MKNIYRPNQLKAIIAAAFIAGISNTQAANTLIDSVTRNGDFETGATAPWLGLSAVNNNAMFASHGQWFGVVTANPVGPLLRQYVSQNLSATPAEGLAFSLTFDARTGATGFDRVEASLAGFNTNGAGVSAAPNQIQWPALTESAWGSYQIGFQLPQTWNGGGELLVQISFWKSGSVIGTTYTGFLDNIILQQIPEPSAFVLCLTAGIIATKQFIRRRSRKRQ